MSRTQASVVSPRAHNDAERQRAFRYFMVFFPTTRKTFGVAPWGEELLAVELIHALTRREELRFIPQSQKIFLW